MEGKRNQKESWFWSAWVGIFFVWFFQLWLFVHSQSLLESTCQLCQTRNWKASSDASLRRMQKNSFLPTNSLMAVWIWFLETCWWEMTWIIVCAGWVVLQILSLGVERIQIEHFQFDDFLNIWEAFCMTHKTEEKNIEFMDNFIKYYLVFWVLNQGSF